MVYNMKSKWIECSCWSPDHGIRMSCDNNSVWIEACLKPHKAWPTRIWLSLKYIFTGKFTPMLFGWSVYDEYKKTEGSELLREFIEKNGESNGY